MPVNFETIINALSRTTNDFICIVFVIKTFNIHYVIEWYDKIQNS